MKVIECRAWHRLLDEMYCEVGGSLLSDTVEVKRNNGYVTNVLPENIVLMQSTGLKDKSGKEIYEGDIVKCYDHKNKTSFTGAVSFQSASFFIETSSCSHFRWTDYEVEVIGNIYENKDLLND